MTDTVDFTNAGAIPSLDDVSVLGAPKTIAKSKTNVGRFVVVGFVIVGILFVVAGLLIYQKNKKTALVASASKPQPAAPGFSQKNLAVDSVSIDQAKAELKRKQLEAEVLSKSTASTSSVTLATPTPEPSTSPFPPVNQPAQQQPRAANNSPAYQAQPQPQVATPATPLQRKLAGSVLLDNNGSKSKLDGASSERDAQQREVQARLNNLSTAQPSPGLFANQQSQPSSNQQLPSEGIASRLIPTSFAARSAGKLPNLDFLLKRGTTIPCALKTAIDTTLPGLVICKVISDVYSANGKTLLIERGADIFGEQQSTLKQGQERTFVLWSRVDNPSGVSANIDSPAVDQNGASGIPGYVDTQFWKRFGGAIMLSFIKDFSAAYSQRLARDGVSVPPSSNTNQAAQDLATEALRNSINIPPVLFVLPATVVNVMLSRDISFENVYGIVQ